MTTQPLFRAATALGAVGVVSPVFALSTSSNNNFVQVANLGLVVLVLLGACAMTGGFVENRTLVCAAGAGYAAAAALQLAQFGRPTNWLDGSGSTFALMFGLAIGLLTVGLASPRSRTHDRARPVRR